MHAVTARIVGSGRYEVVAVVPVADVAETLRRNDVDSHCGAHENGDLDVSTGTPSEQGKPVTSVCGNDGGFVAKTNGNVNVAKTMNAGSGSND